MPQAWQPPDFCCSCLSRGNFCREQVTKDGMSCVFDVAHNHMDEILELCENEDWFERCTELPPLKVGVMGALGGKGVCIE